LLIAKLLAFALGGMVSVVLYQRRLPAVWCVVVGIVVYVVADLAAERFIFGQL